MIRALYDRRRIFLLSTIAILFIFISIGCFQSNKSKIIGNWKAQPIDKIAGSIEYTLFEFYKQGIVTKITGQSKIMGRYKFENANKKISIIWDNGNSEVMNVSFPQKNKMLLGKYAMEKTR